MRRLLASFAALLLTLAALPAHAAIVITFWSHELGNHFPHAFFTLRGTPDAGQLAAASPTVNLAPIAYNLGVSVGWKKFALSGDLAKVDLAGLPGSRESVDLGVSYSTRKFTGRVKAAADRPLPGAPALVEEAPSYSVDVGGSYSLTRNLDVTAGVRYKSERNRLEQIDAPHHDSQAVYIGTAFRF